MKKFLAVYLNADPKKFDSAWQNQEQQIAAIRSDPLGAKAVEPGELHKIDNAELRQPFEAESILGRARMQF